MDEYEDTRPLPRRRRRVTILRGVFRMVGGLLGRLSEGVGGDVATITHAWRLFVGLTLVIVGLLSFTSDRYCDGSVSSYVSCTRSATYYYYPWWAVVLVVAGGMLVTLWLLRRR